MKSVLHGAPWLSAMARVFDRAGAPLYVVGGGVRNPLMGLPLSDVDVCGPLLPDDVCALCAGTPVRAQVRAAELGTVELYVRDEAGVEQMAEYTAWREDVYSGGHTPCAVRFTRDIAVDARRRDFSVNALYQRVHDGWVEEVTDPTGGLAHLRQGVLHTTTDNPDLILGFDGQRILRAARFQAEMDLVPTPETLQSLRRNCRLLTEISPERLRAELEKLMMADLRYPTLQRRFPATQGGLETLRAIGAWELLFPGIVYDEAAVSALARFPGTLAGRMALLLHTASPDEAQSALLRLRFPVKVAAETALYLTALNSLGAPVLTLAQLGRGALETARDLCLALGQSADAAEAALQKIDGKPLTLRELAVSGGDLKPLLASHGRPPKETGRMLEELWRLVLEGALPNARAALLEQADQLLRP